MIYEMRIDTFANPSHVSAFQEQIGNIIDYRNVFSRIGAFWRSEIGNVNQVIHIWPYDSFEQRAQVRVAASQEGKYPPRNVQGLIGETVEILNPTPLMRPWGEVQELGKIYEVRTYAIKPGSVGGMIKAMEKSLPEREKLSPLAGCWYTEFGELWKWIHVWPYESLDERAVIRAKAMELPSWPPATKEFILNQESRIMIPAPFSTMR